MSPHQEPEISHRELLLLLSVFCLCLALMHHLHEEREDTVGEGLRQKIKSISDNSQAFE